LVFDLVVEGEAEPIGVTELHPFWSEDRQAYVAAGELRIGERLSGEEGRTPRVLSFTQRAEPEAVYTIEVDGDHCYRVGRQGLLVHNMSQPNPGGTPTPTGYQQHNYGEPDADRRSKNTCNVAYYFQTTPGTAILQIAAGDNVYPGALSEDVNQYADKSQPKLLANVGEQLAQYLPAGKLFNKVVVVNARNLTRKDIDYKWIFDIAGPVMASGATIVIAGVDQNQPSMQWMTANEQIISSLGFTKVSPATAGATEQAEAAIRSLPGSTTGGLLGGTAMYSNANAVQVVWRKN
jgi:hypothetical protein